MLISSTDLAATQPFEDPIAHLTCSSVLEYKKDAVIYSPRLPSTKLYMIVRGTVKVHCMCDDGRDVMVDIYHFDEFFGESALLNSRNGRETAIAMEPHTRV